MANRRHPMQLHRTTVTIAGTAAVIAAITTLRVSTDAYKIKKGEPGGSPFLLIGCVVSEARQVHVCFESDSHRESGVFSFCSALSPVESCPLRSSWSSHLPVYSLLVSIASED
jgi:hypothetical protein